MTYGYTYGWELVISHQKNKKYISLKSENDEEVDKIISKYNEIIKIINRYPGTKVTFLETPVYSIKIWNESKGHKYPNVFVEQDENLSKQIYTLNGKVREINKSWHTFTRFFIRSESQRQVPVWKGQETEDQKILQLQTILRRHPSRQPAIKNLVKENIRTGQKRLLGKYQFFSFTFWIFGFLTTKSRPLLGLCIIFFVHRCFSSHILF